MSRRTRELALTKSMGVQSINISSHCDGKRKWWADPPAQLVMLLIEWMSDGNRRHLGAAP